MNKARYSIGEASRLTGLEAHVLRFWETEFKQLAPRKSRKGRRIYNQEDIEIILRIKKLLYEKKYTIEGAKRALSEQSADFIRQTEISFVPARVSEVLAQVKKDLNEILDILK
jgi:DNA-binding transcriptional MerR regulator